MNDHTGWCMTNEGPGGPCSCDHELPAAPVVDNGAELFEELWSMEYRICGDQTKAKAFARDFLNRHAHALAEQIRSHPECEMGNYGDGLLDASMVIDPEELP